MYLYQGKENEIMKSQSLFQRRKKKGRKRRRRKREVDTYSEENCKTSSLEISNQCTSEHKRD